MRSGGNHNVLAAWTVAKMTFQNVCEEGRMACDTVACPCDAMRPEAETGPGRSSRCQRFLPAKADCPVLQASNVALPGDMMRSSSPVIGSSTHSEVSPDPSHPSFQ